MSDTPVLERTSHIIQRMTLPDTPVLERTGVSVRTIYTTYTSWGYCSTSGQRALYYISDKRNGQSRTMEGQHKGVYGKRIRRPKDNKDKKTKGSQNTTGSIRIRIVVLL
jgi:hypothetical protein